MNNDLVGLAMDRAVKSFGGDGIFNAAGFSNELMRLANLKGSIDGHLVRAILTGRADVMVLHGGAHYQRITKVS